MKNVIVNGSFDNLQSRQVRFLEEAARLGPVHALLWTDEVCAQIDGYAPTFPLAERRYFLQAIRFVQTISLFNKIKDRDSLPYGNGADSLVWVVDEEDANDAKKLFCVSYGLGYHIVKDEDLHGWPALLPKDGHERRKKVIVTGCYDWLHSGHVRFFEETSQFGDLYVAVGHDENLRLLKGEEHPMFSQDERRYMVQSIRYVKQALITTGSGWMDAGPEIERLKPDIYAVNEEGDKPEKRQFCQDHNLEYVVLKRLPKEGLPKRESTILRGFY